VASEVVCWCIFNDNRLSRVVSYSTLGKGGLGGGSAKWFGWGLEVSGLSGAVQ
jgi:hypothetical protein